MIEVRNVSMDYRLMVNKANSMKEFVLRLLKRDVLYTNFHALDNITISIDKGEVVGIIGRNGAGKSTFLKLVCGILKPTAGSINVEGNIVPMLELGSGFDFELSGVENIYLNGSLLGYSEKTLNDNVKDIIEFSELGEFVNQPLRNYSSGMVMRLAFSIATILKPEILVVDEILAVGDSSFQEKSKAKMMELMSGGTTVLFTSHSLGQIRELCDRVMWLDHGKIIMLDQTNVVCDAYEKFISEN